MNNRIKDMHVLILYGLAFLGILILLLSDFDKMWYHLLASLCWLFSFTIRNLFLYKIDAYRKYALVTYVVEVLLLFTISFFGADGSIKLLLLVTVADCLISQTLIWGVLSILSAFLLYITQFVIRNGLTMREIILIIGEEAPLFLFVGLISYLLGHVIKSNILVEKTMRETEIREVELEAANYSLGKANENIEEMVTIKERNRIAREIHDTVGHTITNVIVEMEAGRMLSQKNQPLAMEKYTMAQQQAVKALEELRGSVRLLANENAHKSFVQKLTEVIKETELHANITIKSDIAVIEEKVKPELAELINTVLKEGLSNGIRHGGGTAFYFSLKTEADSLHFLLQDNGRGCDDIKYGFGLTHMKKRILEAGGKIDFNSEAEEGFEIQIKVPL